MTKLDSILWRHRSTLEREDSLDNSTVKYIFPLGFMIQINDKGITFVGTSVNYDTGSIMLVQEAIRWAIHINKCLREKSGIPSQLECEGKLILQSKGQFAWYKGAYKEKVKDERTPDGTVFSAAVILRRMSRKKEIEDAARD